MGKYDDILYYEYHGSNKKPMDLNDRAKIFLPFAALKGYEELIDEASKIHEVRSELSEDAKKELDRCLQLIKENIESQPIITIRYFEEIEGSTLGHYYECTGKCTSLDIYKGKIEINEVSFYLDDIYEIHGDIVERFFE